MGDGSQQKQVVPAYLGTVSSAAWCGFSTKGIKTRTRLLLGMTERKGFIVAMRHLEESRLNWTMTGAGAREEGMGKLGYLVSLP